MGTREHRPMPLGLQGFQKDNQLGKALYGRRWNDKRRKELSEALKRRGIIPPSRKGCAMPESAKKRISDYNKKINRQPPHPRGENHPLWKGGQATERLRKTFYEKQRRARKAIGHHALGEWETLKVQYGFSCPACGKVEPEIKLTEDHIIPLMRGGSNYIENIQPLCGRCNSKKGTKIGRAHV